MEPERRVTHDSSLGRRAAALLVPIFVAPFLVCLLAALLLWLVGPGR